MSPARAKCSRPRSQREIDGLRCAVVVKVTELSGERLSNAYEIGGGSHRATRDDIPFRPVEEANRRRGRRDTVFELGSRDAEKIGAVERRVLRQHRGMCVDENGDRIGWPPRRIRSSVTLRSTPRRRGTSDVPIRLGFTGTRAVPSRWCDSKTRRGQARSGSRRDGGPS